MKSFSVLGPCLFVVLIVAPPTKAASSISPSVSTACGYVKIGGSVTLDAGSSISANVRVKVAIDGCVATTFDFAPPGSNGVLSGTSPSTFSSGTYDVVVEVDITDKCCVTSTYVYVTTVIVP